METRIRLSETYSSRTRMEDLSIITKHYTGLMGTRKQGIILKGVSDSSGIDNSPGME
jgi:hypothetical protein